VNQKITHAIRLMTIMAMLYGAYLETGPITTLILFSLLVSVEIINYHMRRVGLVNDIVLNGRRNKVNHDE